MTPLLAALDVPLGPLGEEAFSFRGAPTTWGEVAAFVTGALCVWLVARQHVANWPIGIANAVFFLLLFASYGLYADSALQLLYIVLGAYGWWAWLHGGAQRDELAVSRTTSAQWVLVAGATAVVTAGLWVLLDRVTDSTVPAWDALTTALSLAATWGQTRKKVESWWIWIAADAIYIPLYGYKNLWLTAGLYVTFAALCIAGLRSWTADLGQRERTGAPAQMAVTT
jgi:nicotinamide mononucleotide transporter